MTWLALRALLRRVPGIAWVITGAVAIAALALAFTWHASAVHEQRTLHRHALADSITKETTVLETAQLATDSARAVAKFAKRQADYSRQRRETARADVESLLADLPEPVVTLIKLDDQLARRDSVALVAYVAVDTALVQERGAAADLDRLRVNQAAIGVEPPKHHAMRYVLAGAALGVASVFLLHAVR